MKIHFSYRQMHSGLHYALCNRLSECIIILIDKVSFVKILHSFLLILNASEFQENHEWMFPDCIHQKQKCCLLAVSYLVPSVRSFCQLLVCCHHHHHFNTQKSFLQDFLEILKLALEFKKNLTYIEIYATESNIWFLYIGVFIIKPMLLTECANNFVVGLIMQ